MDCSIKKERVMNIQFSGYGSTDEANVVRATGGFFLALSIPFGMLMPHENQAQKNHNQSLSQLAARQGISACEAVAILEDRPWQQMSKGDANMRLLELWIDYNKISSPQQSTLTSGK